ncbi:streptophobe family protein [Streptomyces sp. SID8352]|uniref:streptophobe family protein n=1 Tax=Streptomyces sp. SID8352 TaxID=2690338 RepID=UPI00139D8D6C|nr:hypothetical protein [Streptomyces sp. SID8352]
MSARTPAVPAASPHGWARALLTVLSALVAMAVVASLGLWAAGATGLPGGAFPRVVMAVVVIAVGGSVELSGDAGGLVGSDAALTVLPLSVTLTGALVLARGFVRPLRHGGHGGTAGARESAGWAGRIAVLWSAALLGLAFAARRTFAVPLGEGLLNDLGDFFGIEPRVGFTTDVPSTVLFGLLWLAGVLVVALLLTDGAALPGRLRTLVASARPAACAMVALLLACVVLGLVVGLVAAGTRGHPAETFAVLLLGLPNLAWLALTIGLGAAWDGRVEGPFGLPMPRVLDEVLRTPDISTLDLGTLTERDGRMWWLPAAAVVLLLASGLLAAVLSPAGTPLWAHAARLAGALVCTVLMICLVGRVYAHYGLSVLGIGDLGGGLTGQVFLRPRTWTALWRAALWGAAAGLVGALLVRWSRAGRRAGAGRGGRDGR